MIEWLKKLMGKTNAPVPENPKTSSSKAPVLTAGNLRDALRRYRPSAPVYAGYCSICENSMISMDAIAKCPNCDTDLQCSPIREPKPRQQQ